MKKRLTTVLLVCTLLLTMTGCSVANAARKLDAAEDLVEQRLDAAEDKLENSFRKAVSPTTAPFSAGPETAPAETQAAPATTEKRQPLTAEEALQIALDYLGFTAGQISRLHSEYEIDDGIPQFEIGFFQGDWEYEFEIHAESGQILSYDKDHKYD